MAQYDLVFVKNDALSGVSYNEIRLGKPADVGYSLTQNPTTGQLSWAPSMNLIGTLSGTFNYNDAQKTGYYIIDPTSTPVENTAPKYYNGILEVYKAPNGAIFQRALCYSPVLNVAPITFLRNYIPSVGWSNWAPIETIYTPPTRPIEDTRAPYTEGSTDSVALSIQALENALMDHTFNHISEGSYTLSVGSWMDEGSIKSYELSIPDLVPEDFVDVIPWNNSVDGVIEAEILPNVSVNTGYIGIQAKHIPSVDIDITVRVYKHT